ncbi:YjgN family protein [Undibacterium sp. Di27W]|uniref:YjgN family protein n=1 Tax=Undibacterium sp. Di27W TaxID=3413036 RepID=UPI003BF443F3
MQIQTEATGMWPTAANTEPATTNPDRDAAAAANAVAATEQQTEYNLSFTGTGKEYFRIWIVNLCLSLATLGIYSAWAKVRRLSYFDRNTQLNGAAFNFHGDPKIIFRGRVIAVILLFCYHYLFSLSKTVALSLFFIFLLGIPWIMRSALRFRLRNTSYLGLRFQFHGTLSDAFKTYTPLGMMVLLPALVGVLIPHRPTTLLYAFIPYLSWPWLHARMRMYQHKELTFAQLRSRCSLTRGSFFLSYFIIGLSLLVFAMLVGMGAAVFFASLKNQAMSNYQIFMETYGWLLVPVGFAVAVLAYAILLSGSTLLQVKIWNKSWNATSFPGIAIDSHLPYKAYYFLQMKNLLLTLLTLGLYRPFAVVNVYRFRLQHVSLKAAGLEQILASQYAQVAQAGKSGQVGQASGESSADLFGFDLSW